MLRILAFTAILLNVVTMAVWFILNPPATYEKLAHRDLVAAHDAFRKVSAEQSYTLYQRVADGYSRSTFSSEARFYAARTAFLGLGQFAEAEKQLAEFIESKPTNEEQLKEAQDYLDLIRARADLPEASRDDVLWEYVQAITEEGNGKFQSSLTRLEWIVENYGTSGLGQKAEPMRQRVSAKLDA
ncbi:MAG: hypothetical protein AAB229_07500 [Candidatus Hydrogenedentota bacterium]